MTDDESRCPSVSGEHRCTLPRGHAEIHMRSLGDSRVVYWDVMSYTETVLSDKPASYILRSGASNTDKSSD